MVKGSSEEQTEGSHGKAGTKESGKSVPVPRSKFVSHVPVTADEGSTPSIDPEKFIDTCQSDDEIGSFAYLLAVGADLPDKNELNEFTLTHIGRCPVCLARLQESFAEAIDAYSTFFCPVGEDADLERLIAFLDPSTNQPGYLRWLAAHELKKRIDSRLDGKTAGMDFALGWVREMEECEEAKIFDPKQSGFLPQ